MIVYLRWPLVVWVGDNAPAFLDYDMLMPNGPAASVGQVWNGSAFVAPTANSAEANLAALMANADSALTSLQAGIDQTNTWRTTGPGAGTTTLTSAQLSAAERQSADNQLTTMRALKGVIRLLRNQLDSVS